MHWRPLSGTPDEADEGRSVEWVAMQQIMRQVLTIADSVTGGEGFGEPVVMRHRARARVAGWLQHHVLGIALMFEHPGHCGHEVTQGVIDIRGVP